MVRQLIETSLLRKLEKGIGKIEKIIQQGKLGKQETKESHHQIIANREKSELHIARRFDGMTGLDFLFILAGQLAD